MKKETRFILLFAVSFIMLSGKCKMPMTDYEYPLYLQNNSDKRAKFTVNNRYNAGPQYPDTTLFWEPIGIVVQAQEKRAVAGGSLNWEKIYKSVPNDTLSFVIFDADTLAKYPWEVIRNNYKILKRYDLSLDDLKRLNYTLYYPATEAMKGMKMYPAYP